MMITMTMVMIYFNGQLQSINLYDLFIHSLYVMNLSVYNYPSIYYLFNDLSTILPTYLSISLIGVLDLSDEENDLERKVVETIFNIIVSDGPPTS